MIPFGYVIENGIVKVNEEEAEQVVTLYAGYLLGLSYKAALTLAGIKTSHTQAKHIMQNEHYLGDAVFPQIIDEETFNAAEEERMRRERILGRSDLPKKTASPVIHSAFFLGDLPQEYDDPIKQAEYIYSLIEVIR